MKEGSIRGGVDALDQQGALRQQPTENGSRGATIYWLLGVIWLGGLLGIFLPTSIWAHGGGTPQLAGESAGPYRVYAWTSPDPWRAGEAHIDVAVAKPASEEGATPDAEMPVTDAEVQVQLTQVETGATLTLPANPLVFLNSFYYEADFELPEPGMWQVEIRVAADEGTGSASFNVEALPPREINWFLLGGGLFALVATAVLWALWSNNAASTPQPRGRLRGQQSRSENLQETGSQTKDT